VVGATVVDVGPKVVVGRADGASVGDLVVSPEALDNTTVEKKQQQERDVMSRFLS
jgi:hypothetical protein